MNPSATQIIFSTTQAVLVFFGLLASAFGIAFSLGRFSKAQDILTREVRSGFQHVNLNLANINSFREVTLQERAATQEWRRVVDDTLEDLTHKVEALRGA